MNRNTNITIDLAAIRKNVAAICETLSPQTKMMAVVKADGYGHGSIETAKAALLSGATWLGVAIPWEGFVLRGAGIHAPILVLGPLEKENADAIPEYGLVQGIGSLQEAKWLHDACKNQNKKAQIHLKFDTGMGRIGIRQEHTLEELLTYIQQSAYLELTGAFTHFADADGENSAYTQMQFHRFLQLAKLLPQGLMLHCSNSAATLRYPQTHLDMVRVGIAMYGCPPVKTRISLEMAMRWAAEVTFIKKINSGDCISYGCTFTAQRPMKVATLGVGYGDGYHRRTSGKGMVLIDGCFAPVLGRVCMDQMMVDVTQIPNVHLGAEAILLGKQGDNEITGDMLGSYADTISYEVLLAPTGRVCKRYIHE